MLTCSPLAPVLRRVTAPAALWRIGKNSADQQDVTSGVAVLQILFRVYKDLSPRYFPTDRVAHPFRAAEIHQRTGIKALEDVATTANWQHSRHPPDSS